MLCWVLVPAPSLARLRGIRSFENQGVGWGLGVWDSGGMDPETKFTTSRHLLKINL